MRKKNKRVEERNVNNTRKRRLMSFRRFFLCLTLALIIFLAYYIYTNFFNN